MHQPTFKNILFVINPVSGGIDKEELDDSLGSFCQTCGLSHDMIKTTGKDDEKKLRASVDEKNPEVVVAIGGDGTVNLVASVLAGTDKPMGILPMGSGNGLAKDLKIPQNDPDAALELLRTPFVRKIDTLEVNGNFFVHICDLGFNAHVVKMFAKSQHRGMFSYMKFTLVEFFKYDSFSYTLYTDNSTEEFSGKAFMITCANSNMYGSNIVINPEGQIDDGYFEVVIIKDFRWYKIFKMVALLATRRINTWEMSRTIRCKQASISLKKKKTLQFDGEVSDNVKHVKVSIVPASLKIVCDKTNQI
ncbi:MAG: diacylglycerol kinase family protein [Cyclobacteriaceae bacterium]